MPIPVKCQTCGYAAHAADSESGKIAKCPKCKQLIHIPDVTWQKSIERDPTQPPPFTPELVEIFVPPEKPKRSQKARGISYNPDRVKRWIKGAAFWVSLVMFLGTMREPYAAMFSHYVALIVASVIGFSFLMQRIPAGYRNWSVTGATVLVVILWGYNDYMIVTREERTDLNDGRLVRTDYRWRFGGRTPFYRDGWIFYDDGTRYHTEGPFSETGKQHGHWHGFDASYESFDQWYWYGEEITEGEWHLRNR